MKIYTDYIDIELTIDEFENILDSGLLNAMIATVTSLSVLTGYATAQDEESEELAAIMQLLTAEESTDDDEVLFLSDNALDYLEREDYDHEPEDDNDTVDRIYDVLFGV